MNIRHGFTSGPKRAPEYEVWLSMVARCSNAKHKWFKHYGGRGIKVHAPWLSFPAFIEDVGLRPSSGHSLDRWPDMNGNYEPGNVRWATWDEQGVNRRDCVYLTVCGERLTLSQCSRLTGYHQSSIARRVARGMSHEDAVLGPPHPRQKGNSNFRALAAVPASEDLK